MNQHTSTTPGGRRALVHARTGCAPAAASGVGPTMFRNDPLALRDGPRHPRRSFPRAALTTSASSWSVGAKLTPCERGPANRSLVLSNGRARLAHGWPGTPTHRETGRSPSTHAGSGRFSREAS